MPHLQRLEGGLDAQRHACNVAVTLLQLCPALHHVQGEWTNEQGGAVAPIRGCNQRCTSSCWICGHTGCWRPPLKALSPGSLRKWQTCTVKRRLSHAATASCTEQLPT